MPRGWKGDLGSRETVSRTVPDWSFDFTSIRGTVDSRGQLVYLPSNATFLGIKEPSCKIYRSVWISSHEVQPALTSDII